MKDKPPICYTGSRDARQRDPKFSRLGKKREKSLELRQRDVAERSGKEPIRPD